MKIGEHEVVVISRELVKVGCQTVDRVQVQAVLKLMDEWRPAPAFSVGDFVRVSIKQGSSCLTGYSRLSVLYGKCGKIVARSEQGAFGVEFPEADNDLHNLGGATSPRHGFWFDPSYLEKVE